MKPFMRGLPLLDIVVELPGYTTNTRRHNTAALTYDRAALFTVSVASYYTHLIHREPGESLQSIPWQLNYCMIAYWMSIPIFIGCSLG